MDNPIYLKMKLAYNANTQNLSQKDRLTTITEMMQFLSGELQKLNEPATKQKYVWDEVREKKNRARAATGNALMQFHSQNRENKRKELLADGWKESFSGKTENWFGNNPKEPGVKLILKSDGSVKTQKV